MKTAQKDNLKIAALTLILLGTSQPLDAQNKLTVTRATLNTLEVKLENTDAIAGLQFSLRSSSDVVLNELERTDRTADAQQWTVASYKPNDSTINVVILNTTRGGAFSGGKGAVAKVSFRMPSPGEVSRVVFGKVLLANQRAESVGVAIENLVWSNKVYLADNGSASAAFALGQNYPNPFNPSTQLAYRLDKAAQVRLCVFDVTGREVNRLVDQYQNAGQFMVTWTSRDDAGRMLPSGIYFARLQVDNDIATRKMILAK